MRGNEITKNEFARDMVLFQNTTRGNLAVGPTVMPKSEYLVLHVEQFNRYIPRSDVDGGRVKIIKDPKTISKPLMVQNGTYTVPAMRLDTDELAGYEDLYGEPPPEGSAAAPKKRKPGKTKPRAAKPKPKILEW